MENTLNMLQLFCDVEKLTDVLVTKDYHLFGYIKGNREVDPTNKNNIIESLQTKQILESAIIVGLDKKSGDNKPFKIIEGQHRFEACKELQLPLSFIIREDFDIESMEKSLSIVELLNTASKTWDISNFMYSKAIKGFKPYLLYRELYEKYDFEHEILLYVINKREDRKMYIRFRTFKEGNLQFDEDDYNYAVSKLEILQRILPKIEENGKRYYLKALIDIMNTPDIDNERLLDRFMNSKVNIPLSKTVEKCYDVIVKDIYNKGLTKNKLVMETGDKDIEFRIKTK
jgi:ParB-like nuclease domain